MSKFKEKFVNVDLKDLKNEAKNRHEKGWRYVQTLALKVDDKTELIYSFMKDGALENLKVSGLTKKDTVPSITDEYIEAFVWENEIHDLWDIKFEGIAIDFKGKFYNVATDAPMTVVGPEVLERREKQAKLEAAMAAKSKKEEGKGE